MAIRARAVYYYDSNYNLIKQGSLTVGEVMLEYSDTEAVINQGDVGTKQIVIAMPTGTFSGGAPFLTIQSPKGRPTTLLAMGAATWNISGMVTGVTAFQVFYYTLNLIGNTYYGGRHAMMCGYLTNTGYENLDIAYYTVQDGISNYELIEADTYEEIYTTLAAVFSDHAARITEAEADIVALEGQDADFIDGTTTVKKAEQDASGNVITTTYATKTEDAAKIPLTYLDTDGTLAANSDTKVPSQKAVKTYADTKASKAGDNVMTGENQFQHDTYVLPTSNPLSIGIKFDPALAKISLLYSGYTYASIDKDGLYLNPSYVTSVGANNVPTHAMVDGYIALHNSTTGADDDVSAIISHPYIRSRLGELQAEIDRLNALGRSWGELDLENADMSVPSPFATMALRDAYIFSNIQERFTGYTLQANDYVYDLGVLVDGVPTNYHVWKYNVTATHWIDEGIESAIGHATNALFGLVKGDGTYVSIIDEIMQILKADYATNVGAVGGYYTYAQLYAYITDYESRIAALETQISQKVDKVTGKQLSTEDYTTTEKSKLGGITDGAQVNVIEKIKVNGVERPIVLKAVDIYINFDSITEYGVREIVSQSSPTLERVKRIGSDMLIGSATGLVAAAGIDAGTVTNSFDSVSIFQRSRNVLPDGNVFVRVPKYYIKEEWVLDGATNYHYIWMCQSKLAGYRLPLSFAKEDGSENDCYFIGAYEASLGGDSKLKSITGAVTKVSYSRAQFRTAARLNDGLGAASKYQITDIAEYVDLVQIPMMIEFATKNTQLILRGFVDASYTATHLPLLAETAVNRVILTNTQAAAYRVGQMIDIGTSQGGRQVAQDRQIVSITVDTPVAGQSQIIFDGAAVTTTLTQMVYNVSQKTGQCDAVVASSGSKTANDGKNSCIWRGMENPYGNTYKNIDGVKISNNQTWICLFPSLYNDTASVAGDYASPFVKLSYININANGYCVALGYDPLYPFAKFPTSITGGSSVLYFSDYYYQSTGDRTVFVGGSWGNSSNAGPFYWFLFYGLGFAGLDFGARLSKRP